MRFAFFPLFQRLACAALLGLAASAAAQVQPDSHSTPDQFVLRVANEALDVLKADDAVKAGNIARINQIVDAHILPYVNFQKSTRLAAGRYWRQATEPQKAALADAFRGTLVRTYSGALTRITPDTTITALPFRGDPKADDVVVRTLISQANGQPISVQYRLEKIPQGWKIYDVNVEGIWLIENYRNQFAQQINQNGIDGLIQALNQRSQ